MQDSQPKPSRRGFFFGAATAGVAAAAVAALPRIQEAMPPSEESAAKPAPDKGGGYSLSEHVKRYYNTTLI